MLADERGKLTETISHLIRDVQICLFRRRQDIYDTVDLRWMAHAIMEGATPAQAYPASLVLSSKILSTECAREILRKLEGTCKEEEARKNLEDNSQE